MALSTTMIICLAAILKLMSGNLGQQLNGYINPIWLESDRLAAAINNRERSTSSRPGPGSLAALADYRLDAGFSGPRLADQWLPNNLGFTGGLQSYPAQLSLRFFRDQQQQQQQQQLLDDLNYQRQFFYDRQQPPPVIRDDDVLQLSSSPAVAKQIADQTIESNARFP